MSPLSRFYRFILLSRDKISFVVLAAIGFLPVGYAFVAGTFHSRWMYARPEAGCGRALIFFRGMDEAYNWWIFPVALPLALFLLRYTATRILGAAEDGHDFTPPSVTLVPPPACNRRRDELVRVCTHPAVFSSIFVIVAVIHFFDMRDVVRTYVNIGRGAAAVTCPDEFDWSVYFVQRDSPVTRAANAVHVVVAYAAQFIAAYLALNVFAIFLLHNIFYLRLIYQRHGKSEDDSIVLDFDDKEDCFGQGLLHPIFNLQIIFLIATGIFVLFSRYQNVTGATTENATKRLEEVLAKVDATSILPALVNYFRSFSSHDLFHDAGQIILAVSFVIVFAIIAIPSLIKFLPFRQLALFNNGVAPYLAEFLPRGQGRDPLHMDHEELLALASKFARNSFWPAGDPKAERLFAFVYLVLLFIFVPLPFKPVGAFVVATLLLFGAAVALTVLTFIVYRYFLGYVGKPLIQKPKDS